MRVSEWASENWLGAPGDKSRLYRLASGVVLVVALLTSACGSAGRAPEAETNLTSEQAADRDEQPAGPMARFANSLGVGGQGGTAAAALPAAPKPVVAQVPSGTPIRVRTTSTLSTNSVQSGQEFVATLADPLVIDGETIAPRGTDVIGRVVNTDPGGRVKGVASISLALARLRLANGQEVNLETSRVTRNARTTKKQDATKIGIGSGTGAVIGAIAGGGKGAAIGAAAGAGAGTGVVLATRGEPAVVPAESLLTFTTRAPLTVRY